MINRSSEIYDQDIFDPDRLDHVVAVVWWLTHLLGDRVVIPVDDDEFWNDNFPANTRLTLRQEGDQLVMYSEILEDSDAST
jgi:hypothetical protein